MEQGKRWISSQILFEAMKEVLQEEKHASFTVTGMSMWPFLCHGRDQVIVERVRQHQLRRGDVILYQVAEDHYILHRITSLGQEYLQTTGDSNLFRDPPVPYHCVVARVCQVVRKGKKMDCNSKWWRLLSYIWMSLFGLRKYMMWFWFRIRKYKR